MSVTLKTIADEVGASVATVSLALSDHPRVSEKTKRRVRETSARLGYQSRSELAAKRLRRGATGRVLRFQFVVLGVHNDTRLQMQYSRDMLPYLIADPAKDGYRVELISCPAQDSTELVSYLQAHRREVDGYLLARGVEVETLRELAAADLTVVQLGPATNGMADASWRGRIAAVGYDDLAKGAEATGRLLAAGYRRIGMVSAMGVSGLYYDRWADGYRLALAKAGIPVDERLIDRTAGRSFAESPPFAASGDPPEAFVVPDPTHAELLLEACRRDGIPIGPERMVLGGTVETVERTGFAEYPGILTEAQAVVRLALHQLWRLVGAEKTTFFELNLSPLRRHLERIGQA